MIDLSRENPKAATIVSRNGLRTASAEHMMRTREIGGKREMHRMSYETTTDAVSMIGATMTGKVMEGIGMDGIDTRITPMMTANDTEGEETNMMNDMTLEAAGGIENAQKSATGIEDDS